MWERIEEESRIKSQESRQKSNNQIVISTGVRNLFKGISEAMSLQQKISH